MLFVILVVGFLAYIILSAVKPSIIPNELRLYTATTAESESVPSTIEKVTEDPPIEHQTTDSSPVK